VTADLFALRALCMYLIQCGIEKFGKNEARMTEQRENQVLETGRLNKQLKNK
jgi:hypothetical protein